MREKGKKTETNMGIFEKTVCALFQMINFNDIYVFKSLSSRQTFIIDTFCLILIHKIQPEIF